MDLLQRLISISMQITTFIVKSARNKTFKVDTSCENTPFYVKIIFKTFYFYSYSGVKEEDRTSWYSYIGSTT